MPDSHSASSSGPPLRMFRELFNDYWCVWIAICDGFMNIWYIIRRPPEVWTALATIVLAAFSVLLWRVDDRLAKDNEAIQRAFVFLDGVTQVRVIDQQKHSVNEYRLYLRWKNNGSTPTRHMTGHANIGSFDAPLPDTFDYFDKGCANNKIALGPRAEVHIGPLHIPFDALNAVIFAPQRRHIYFWGWVLYNDVFSNSRQHVTQFCMEVTSVPGDVADPNGRSALGYTDCPEHNCYDDECTIKTPPPCK